ncbi:hypothetical protein L218DRAFT_104373 [Marasmius fiardii PR-910]|nr:hypothetical protein L218DRAFT_104373 [Marasmius fiardii PR-910]
MPGLNKSPTPPPEYTPTASNSHGISDPNYGAISGSSTSTPGPFESQSPFHNPWSSVPAFTHGPHPGPTPTGQLDIPYAYYDPRSEHSVMQADSRAKRRFFEALAWVLVTWFVIALVVQGVVDGRFRFEWGKN